MAVRFRRRVKLFPGVHLNFSLSGVSTTIGMRGLSVNLGKKGAYLNTGLPGTGLYSRQKIGGNNRRQDKSPSSNHPLSPTDPYPGIEVGTIRTEQAEATTTEGLTVLKKMLAECYNLRNELKRKVKAAKARLIYSQVLFVFSRILLVGFFIRALRTYRDRTKEYYEDLLDQLEGCQVDIDMTVDRHILAKYEALVEGYKTLITCKKVWDVTSSQSIDRVALRSAASVAITRKPLEFGFKNIDIIRSQYDALHFENANGGDLYIYPAFIAIVDNQKKFGLLDIGEVSFDFRAQNFVEEEAVPRDAMVTDYTWAKVNKNGSRDRRFKANYQIPICKYGYLALWSQTGLNEAYSFSSYSKAQKFAAAISDYQQIIRRAGSQRQPKSRLPGKSNRST